MVDSLKIYELLKNHFPPEQAKSVTEAIQQVEKQTDQDFRSFLTTALAPYATKVDLANLKAELIKWMFIFWIGQFAAMATLIKLMK